MGAISKITGVVALKLCAAVTAAADDSSCPQVPVRVETEDPALRQQLCEVADDAVGLLAECGLSVPLPLTVTVVPDLGPDCLGLYHCGTARIDILLPARFAEIRRTDGPFGGIAHGVHYSSVLVHEMAHAAYDDANCPFTTCPVATEAIAYAMQVRSLPAADRARFEGASPIDPAQAESYLTAEMLAASPERFAAAAWQVHAEQADPCAQVRAIVSGEIVLDRPRSLR